MGQIRSECAIYIWRCQIHYFVEGRPGRNNRGVLSLPIAAALDRIGERGVSDAVQVPIGRGFSDVSELTPRNSIGAPILAH
jgi:hypothetical protein